MTRIPIPPDPSWCVLRNMTVVILMAVLVAGCPAGGGGGAGIIIPAFNVPDLPIVAPATSFETPEFATNSGLDQINAQHAYARNGTGVGVVVGVVDSGIDPAQPDLDANISPSSIDIVSPATPIADTGGHGTAVAGVIAAEKNNVDMHGVAFNATILAVRADAPGLCVSLANCSFFTSDVAAGIDYARENGAKVINLSLGAPGPVSALIRNAIIAAAQAGIIVVAAAGNDSSTVPSAPASLAGDPATLGLMLAVGAVDSANNLASFSNQCGASAQFCLVAPGVGIVTTALTSDPPRRSR